MIGNEDTPAKRKKRGLLPLEEKLGLDQTTEYRTPSAPPPAPNLAQPGMFPNAAAASLEGGNPEAVGDKIRSKLKDRKGVQYA